jgi:methylated-DNA-[protein]-cysteine S-methyltransferase
MNVALLFQKAVNSPIGELRLVAGEEALVAVLFSDDDRAIEAAAAAHHEVLELAARELNQYFAGSRTRFATPLAPQGTEFQRAVWDALCTIPFGETRSYSQIASAIGRANAVRAVGAANGVNPLPLFIPCHRVIGADGTLTGYGGGLPIKKSLLAHEQRVATAGRMLATR